VISSVNGQVGENRSEVLCQVSGQDNKILLNYRYLLDGLTNLGSEEAVLKIISGDSPCVLTAKDGAGYLYIIMPIKQ
jgi:DNA polymerase III sliding clamp (beta) subunit (PCNA family)